MPFVMGLFNKLAEVIPLLVWTLLCLAFVAVSTVRLSETNGDKDMGNWFVVVLAAIWAVGWSAFFIGITLIGSFTEAHQWGS